MRQVPQAAKRTSVTTSCGRVVGRQQSSQFDTDSADPGKGGVVRVQVRHGRIASLPETQDTAHWNKERTTERERGTTPGSGVRAPTAATVGMAVRSKDGYG